MSHLHLASINLAKLLFAVGLWCFRSVKASISMRAQLVLLALLAATLISNVMAFALNPHLLH